MNRYLPLTRTLKGSSGRVARPVVVSFRMGWNGVAEPERRDKALRASGIRMPLNILRGGRHNFQKYGISKLARIQKSRFSGAPTRKKSRNSYCPTLNTIMFVW